MDVGPMRARPVRSPPPLTRRARVGHGKDRRRRASIMRKGRKGKNLGVVGILGVLGVRDILGALGALRVSTSLVTAC